MAGGQLALERQSSSDADGEKKNVVTIPAPSTSRPLRGDHGQCCQDPHGQQGIKNTIDNVIECDLSKIKDLLEGSRAGHLFNAINEQISKMFEMIIGCTRGSTRPLENALHTVQSITQNVEENETLHVVSRFPRNISCYISEN